MKLLKWKKGSNLSLSVRWGSESSPSPIACRLVDSSWSFFRCYLIYMFCLRITEGEARKEIWSSVNHQLFISTLIYGKSQQIRQGIAWSKDLKGVLGLEVSRAWGAWFKVSDKTKGPPAENSFLPKAAYKPPLVRTSFHFCGITCEGPFSVTSCWHKMLY